MNKSFLVAAAAVLASGSIYAGPVNLVGDSIDAAIIRTVDTGYGLGRVTGYGLDSTFIVAEGDSDIKQYSGIFTLDVEASSFKLQFIDQAGWQDGIVLRLSDLNFAGGYLESLIVDTNLVGYSVDVAPTFINIQLGGTSFSRSTFFNGIFVSNQIPEPSSVALVALALVTAAWRRKQHA